MTHRIFRHAAALLSVLATVSGCASNPPVKSEAYARMPDRRTFEYPFPTVWKGIESTFSKDKVIERDPEDVDAIAMRSLTERKLVTDWIYSRSNEKYIEYKVNGTPRKIYLQTRYRYHVHARSVIGGVDVLVHVQEEIERLNPDGTSAGYEKPETPDTSRAGLLLDRINQAILAAPPIGE